MMASFQLKVQNKSSITCDAKESVQLIWCIYTTYKSSKKMTLFEIYQHPSHRILWCTRMIRQNQQNTAKRKVVGMVYLHEEWDGESTERPREHRWPRTRENVKLQRRYIHEDANREKKISKMKSYSNSCSWKHVNMNLFRRVWTHHG
jgi:hypothetical protein